MSGPSTALRMTGGALALLLAGCNAGPPEPVATFWTTRNFLKAQEKNPQPTFARVNRGGFLPSDLLVKEGAPLRFKEGTQAGGHGLTIFPAVADGGVAAFVITEIWADHPEPWVQPVWIPSDESGARPDGVWSVFPVDVASTFYSPFWRMEFFTSPVVPADSYKSARQVLAARGEPRSGPIVLCPIIPDRVGFADDGSGPKEPTTLRPFALPPKVNSAWVDGQKVNYFDFGGYRAQADGQNLVEVPAYFFVSRAGGNPLPLAAVLSADATRNSLVRQVDVVLPEGAAPFVPPSRNELRALLAGLVDVPSLTNPALDAFPQFTLRVATNPRCFDDPTFPATCLWLDSPAKLEALPIELRNRRELQLAIAVVVP